VFENTDNLGYDVPMPSHYPPFEGKPESYSRLANFMSRSWVSFFVDRDPNAWRRKGEWDGVEPEWPLYDVDEPRNFVFLPEGSFVEGDTWRREQIRLINDNAQAFQR
jgi:hypothetical protein